MSLLLRRYHPKPKKVKKTEKEQPKHLGGGWYELPNGDKVKGKKEAQEKLGD